MAAYVKVVTRNGVDRLATASTAASAAYWSQLSAYLTAIRRALYVQLGG